MRSQSVPSSGSTIASEHQRTPSVFAFSSNTSNKELDKRKGDQEKMDVVTLVTNNENANKYDRKKLDRIKEQVSPHRLGDKSYGPVLKNCHVCREYTLIGRQVRSTVLYSEMARAL